MKKCLVATILLAASIQTQAQQMVYKFWVELSDKNNNGYTVDQPEAFLSSKAIERRNKQSISITERDLPITMDYWNQIEAKGVKMLHASKWFNAVTVQCSDTSVMKAVRSLPFVKGSLLLYAKLESDEAPVSADKMMDYLMSLSAPKHPETESAYGFGFGQISMLKGDQLHGLGHRGAGITIAVLDAGFFRMNQMEAFDKMRETGHLLGTWDVVQKDTLVYEDDMHGMNVLSCMASNIPGKMIGTAPDAYYWLIRTEDNFSEFPIEESNWIRGAEMADSIGADVINSSLGYTQFDMTALNLKYKDLNGRSLVSQAATMCTRVGMIVCNAAGNEGDAEWHYVGVPADADSILTVGGVDDKLDHSTFSSYGPTYDGRIKPTICAQATATFVGSSKGKFYPSNGTSFASPVMCGMVASLWGANPGKTNFEVMNAIIQSSDRYSNPDNTYGYGIPDFMMANRLLGGDSTFDYSTDQWLSPVPTEFYNEVPIHFYSSRDQTISIVLRDHKGRRARHFDYQLKKGQFFLISLQDLPKSKKGLQLQITIDGVSKEYSLKRINE
ncbi:MAG: S8 family serine peptidase [Bacteroidetes bacterium]|nr:S8 family serine peptidase [Bacteroidota bacterium]